MLTDAGREVLKSNPKEINVAYLKRYPAYLDFIGPSGGKSGKQEEKEVAIESATPEEVLESAYGKIRKALARYSIFMILKHSFPILRVKNPLGKPAKSIV